MIFSVVTSSQKIALESKILICGRGCIVKIISSDSEGQLLLLASSCNVTVPSAISVAEGV